MAGQLDSLEESLYNEFYEGFERDRERNGEGSKSLYNLGKYVRYIIGATALLLGGKLVRKVKKKQKMSRREFIIDGSLTAATVGLTIHFQKGKEIFGQMYRKNTGEELTQEEIEDVKTDGQVGRAAHYVGVAGAGVGITAIATESRRKFLSYSAFFVVAPAWYYFTIHKGYNSLYNSAVDYTAGERRFEKPTPSK